MYRVIEKFDIYKKIDDYDKYKSVETKMVIKNSVDNPFFSIIIPTYKRAETIKTSIMSAINQVGVQNYEILVINNDMETGLAEIKEIVQEFECDKISYYVNVENIGMCGNWNRAVELARGKYIVMLHDDDVLGPYCLETLAQAIKDNDEPAVIGCSFEQFFDDADLKFIRPDNVKYRMITKQSFFWGRNINIAGMTFKKELAMKYGGFVDRYYPNEDTIFIYQMLLCDKVINIENVLVGYRKGINLSLTDDTMRKIIINTEKTRRSISEHELFAKIWMKIFDKEYIYHYIIGANQYWGLSLKCDDILNELGFNDIKINKIKYVIMLKLLELERRVHFPGEIIFKES